MSDLKKYGKVKLIGETIQVSEKFKKREVILITEEKYPQELKFEFVQDNCSKADDLKEGQFATIFFNISGREWVNGDGKSTHFISLKAWKVEIAVMGPEEKHVSEQMNEQIGDELPF